MINHKGVIVVPNYIAQEDIDLGIGFLVSGEVYPFKDNPQVLVSSFLNRGTYALVARYVRMVNASHRNLRNLEIDVYCSEAFLSAWPTGAEAGVHMDNHLGYEYLEYSSVLYLNDDYSGGEIFFPDLDFEYKPKAGDLVMFPCNSNEYRHGVKKVLSGSRYTIAMWHTTLGHKSVY